MNNKKKFSLNIGMSSILLIFVVLCLISFSILSIASANADMKLSQKVQNRSLTYYDACNQAEDMLADVDSQLHALYEASNDSMVYLTEVSMIDSVYTYPISDLQKLQVTLAFPYPEETADVFYEILSWKVVNVQDVEYDEGLHVIP